MVKKYTDILKDLLVAVGGKENIQHVTHCATRLRLVLVDDEKVDMDKVENLRLAKGAFVVGDQLQIIFGAGLVNEIYKELIEEMDLDQSQNKTGSLNLESTKKQNPFQRFIKSISDVFIEIMPCILAAALLMGLTSLLSTKGLFSEKSVVEMFPAIYGINRIISFLCYR